MHINIAKYNIMLSIEELQEIKNRLPQGALTNIAKKANVSYHTVQKFFNGKSENVKVSNALISEYNEIMASKAKLKELTMH